MRINNNLMAMNTHRQLGINGANTQKSIEKLSSGLRINHASDDAAGLAISEKMRSQIRGLNQASRNGQDAISLVQTAEGAMNESQAILQRMRELAVQSANDTNESEDRNAIQNEIDQLTSELNRISESTEFNKKKLLNGDLSVTGNGKGEKAASTTLDTGVTNVNIASDASGSTGVYNVDITSSTVAEIESNILNGVHADVSVTAGSNVNLAGGAYKVAITQEVSKVVSAAVDTNSIYNTSGGNTAVTVESNSSLANENHTLSVAKRQTSSDNLNGSIALDVSGAKLDGYGSGSYTVTTSRTFDNAKVSDNAAGTGGGNLAADSIISNFQVANSATAAQADALNNGFTLSVAIADDGTNSGIADITFTNSDTGNTVTYTTNNMSNGAQTLQLDGMTFDVDVDNLLSGVTNVGAAAAVGVAAADYDTASLTIAVDAVDDVITVSDGTNTGTASSTADNAAGQALSVTVGTETLDFTIDQSALTSGETLSTTIQSQYTISLSDTSGPAQVGSNVVVDELDLSDPANVTNISFGASGLLVDLDVSGLQALTSQAASYDQTITIGESTEYTAELQNADGTGIAGAGQFALTETGDGNTIDLGKDVILSYDEADLAQGDIFFGVNDNVTEFTFDLTGAETASATVEAGETVDFGNGITLETDATLATSAGTITFEIEDTDVDNSVKMQIGANTGQNIAIDVNDVGANALSVSASDGTATKTVTVDGKNYTAEYKDTAVVEADGAKTEYSLDISDHDKSTAAVEVINQALNSISNERAKLGSFQNRLEHTIKNLQTSSENLVAAESRIRDVDMAKEMMEFTKNNILQQAAQSMLAQANQQPQGVLQLLR